MENIQSLLIIYSIFINPSPGKSCHSPDTGRELSSAGCLPCSASHADLAMRNKSISCFIHIRGSNTTCLFRIIVFFCSALNFLILSLSNILLAVFKLRGNFEHKIGIAI